MLGIEFLGLDSWIGFLGLDIPDLDSWVWIPRIVVHSWTWIPGLEGLRLESSAWIPGFGLVART